jgi:hypothetical protein
VRGQWDDLKRRKGGIEGESFGNASGGLSIQAWDETDELRHDRVELGSSAASSLGTERTRSWRGRPASGPVR